MTHDELVEAIQQRAKARGVLTHYCGPALRCKGDRGAPDLICVGRFRACWIEAKSPYGRLEPEQTTWQHALKAAGQQHYVIREADLESGLVDGLLDGLAYGQSLLPGMVA